MKIEPFYQFVFIEPIEEKQTKGGVIIPEATKDKPIKGTVVAVGPGFLNNNGVRVPPLSKVGDTVLFKRYGPDEIEVEVKGKTKKYLVVRDDEILARLK